MSVSVPADEIPSDPARTASAPGTHPRGARRVVGAAVGGGIAVLAALVSVAVGIGPFHRHPSVVAEIPVDVFATSDCNGGYTAGATVAAGAAPAGSAIDVALARFGLPTPGDRDTILLARERVGILERDRWDGPGTLRLWATPDGGGKSSSVGEIVNGRGDVLEVAVMYGDLC